jgi:hypothetical protein
MSTEGLFRFYSKEKKKERREKRRTGNGHIHPSNPNWLLGEVYD